MPQSFSFRKHAKSAVLLRRKGKRTINNTSIDSPFCILAMI